MKRILYGLLLAAISLLPSEAFAQTNTKLSFEDFSIKAGETKELVIDLDNPDMEVWMMQFDMSLPEGLSIEKNNKGKFVVSKTSRAEDHTLTTNETEGIVRFLLYTSDEYPVEGTSGALIKVSIVADNNFKSGTIAINNIKVTNPANEKFSLSDISIVFKEKVNVAVTIDDATRAYGAANPAFTYKTQPEGIDLTDKLTFSCAATSTSNVGEYAITATSSVNDPDMTVTITPGKLTVTPVALKVTVKDAQRQYGAADPAYEFVYEGFVNSETEAVVSTKPTVTSDATKTSGIGTYNLTVSGGKATNYTFAQYVGGKLTVTPAILKVTAKDVTRPYGSENPTLACNYSGFVNGETESVLTEKPVAATTATKTSSVGTYDITVSGGQAANYTISERVSGKLTVSKAPLTVTAGNASRVYGTANPTFSYTISGFVLDETEAVLTTKPSVSSGATVSTGAGTYSIKASGAAADNYSINYIDGMLTITKAPLKATVKDATRSYGGTAQYSFVYEGFVNGDTQSAVSVAPTVTSTATATSPVGTYDLTLSGGQAANYEFTSYVGGKLTITKAPLKVTAKSISRFYGSDNNLSIIYEGFVNGENESALTEKPVASTNATKSSAIGTYDIIVSGGQATNYEFIGYEPGTLTVRRAELMVKAGNASRVYGTANPTFTYSISGFVLNETEAVLTAQPTVSCSATATSNAGEYPIVVIGGAASNYSFEFVEGKLTVTKAPLKVTANDVTWIDDEEWPTFGVTYEGFVNNDTESSLTKKPVATTTATAASPEGTYAITVSGGSDMNYDFEYVAGTLTVVFRSTLGVSRMETVGDPFDVYNTRGQKVRAGVCTLEGLPKGLYIINGKKVVKE